MRSRFAFLFVSVGLLLTASAPSVRGAGGSFERPVRVLLRRAGCPSSGVSITLLGPGGEVLVDIESDRPRKPASNMKLLTVLSGLELLGPEYSFETRLTARGEVCDGVVEGDLVLWGNGDPTFSSRFRKGDPLRRLREWAKSLRAAGIRAVRGSLLVDDSFFDQVRFLPSWKRGQEGRPYCAQISPLVLADNCVEVHVEPAARVGAKARVVVEPASDFVRVVGAPETGSPRSRTSILIRRKSGGNLLELKGRIALDEKNWFDRVAIEDPALEFAHVLSGVLRAEGIALGRKVSRSRGSCPECPTGRLPAEGSLGLVRHRTPLRIDLPVLLKESQNLHAEILLKSIGARHGGAGSVVGGARAIRALLEKRKWADPGIVIADGSGLSHDDRLTSRLITRLLHAARARPYFDIFLASLPVAGEDGTLARRFRSTPRLKGRVFAKTGYISGVSALSGYLRREGELWTFSMLFEKLPGGLAATRKLQERILGAVDRTLAP